jgi:hypothetical protein
MSAAKTQKKQSIPAPAPAPASVAAGSPEERIRRMEEERALRAREEQMYHDHLQNRIEDTLRHLEVEIERGMIPEAEEYWVDGGHMLTDHFEATLSQARRIADAEPLLHGENVLLYSEHAKKLAVILHRLPALLELARKRVDRDAVLERLLIRIMRSKGESFANVALDLTSQLRRELVG